MSRARMRGFNLVELMISMVLGLVIIGGVIGILLANKRSYGINQGLSQVQETARTAFELMARDIRQAAGNGCDNPTRTSNLLNPGSNWWQTWWGMTGVEQGETNPALTTGSAVGEWVAGTDTIHVQGIEGAGMPIDTHNGGATTISINGDAPFNLGDILIACDFDHAAIFQATGWDPDTDTVTHAASGGSPGNCSSGLGFPHVCDGAAGNIYEFPENALVGRLMASVWYVGNNGRPEEGGRSLYRRRLGPGGVEVTEEMVAGVTNMQVTYGENGSDDIGTALEVGSWANVNSIFIRLTADSADANVSTNRADNNGRIQRTFTYLITLRNRVP